MSCETVSAATRPLRNSITYITCTVAYKPGPVLASFDIKNCH